MWLHTGRTRVDRQTRGTAMSPLAVFSNFTMEAVKWVQAVLRVRP
jgi:hypothetical protein